MSDDENISQNSDTEELETNSYQAGNFVDFTK